MHRTDSSKNGLMLKRRLRWWQIFFISFGGIVGIGFFKGSSTTMAVSGPAGALIATIVVGLIALIVMEAICELINIWPIPNAMVEYVRAFIDEDFGLAIGILYWYTYCIIFSALVIAVGDLADYWATNSDTIDYPFKALIYVCVPLVLLFINALPVEYYGWIEFVGGVVKLVLILGTFILMICINVGVGGDRRIGGEYFENSIQNNENVASNHAVAVFVSIPKAIFAYIGVELLTTTAFEARDPSDLQFPARNIGWCSLVMYALATGSFVANVSWQDRQLPELFQQALTAISDPTVQFPPIRPNAHAAPLIVLLRLNFRFLPAFLNACFIYSALSCANTALYVASRQLYGLTRTIDVDRNSGWLRRFCAWVGSIDHRTKSPWIALLMSVLLTCWVPFIRRHEANFLKEVQDVLQNMGSIACILVWCSQCVAYILFFHWREVHMDQLKDKGRYENLLDMRKVGWLRTCQPYLSYVGAASTFLVVFFFNTASMWNGHTLIPKALSVFVSPAVLLLFYLVKKFTRPRSQRKFFNNLSDWSEFEKRINYLNDQIYPGEPLTLNETKAPNVTITERPAPRPASRDNPGKASWTRSDLTLIPTQGGMAFNRAHSVSPNPLPSPMQPNNISPPHGHLEPDLNSGLNSNHDATAQPATHLFSPDVSSQLQSHRLHSGYVRGSHAHSFSNPLPQANNVTQSTYLPISNSQSQSSLSPTQNGYSRNDLTSIVSNVNELSTGNDRTNPGRSSGMYELSSVPDGGRL